MTEDKRTEMQLYRQQAIIAETRIRAHNRQKMLAKIQSVMDSIDVSSIILSITKGYRLKLSSSKGKCKPL